MENQTYSRYPLKNILIYNSATVVHYLLGFYGILVALDYSTAGSVISFTYLVFAFIQMYILMPAMVCPDCVYTQKSELLCVTGLNVLSRKIFRIGDVNNFENRGKGFLCHNNLYMAAKIIPLLIILPFLILNFSLVLLALFSALLGVLAFRIFYIFKKIACSHCLAKNICPNAKSMGLNE